MITAYFLIREVDRESRGDDMLSNVKTTLSIPYDDTGG